MSPFSTTGKAKLWRRLGACLLVLELAGSTGAGAAEPLKIVALGDSLTAGYGLEPALALPALLQGLLEKRGEAVVVDNAGVSGDTAADGLKRLDWSVGPDADAVIVALGANDMLLGRDPALAKRALDKILKALKKRGLPVLLAGMRAPVNFGTDYQNDFDRLYPDLARKHDALLYPFLLDGVALDPALNQADGIHPNEQGARLIAARILPSVLELIGRARARR